MRQRSVLLFCANCRFLGVAVVDEKREQLLKMTSSFIASKAGDIGIQFLCARCGKVVAEGRADSEGA